MSNNPEKKARKRDNLRQAGVLNPNAQRVLDTLFENSSDFFDPQDNLQVRYEMLRAHLVDGGSVSAVCKRFGVSRQTFYKLQEKFLDEGTSGLLPKPPGPKGASKLTADVLSFVKKCLEQDKPISTSDLLAQVEKKFGLSLHKRTLEKLLKEVRAKKNS
jgi:transposase